MAKEAKEAANNKKGGKGKGHAEQKPHHAPSKKGHGKDKDHNPSGERQHQQPVTKLNENLSKKDRRAIEKLKAQLEYAEAHGQDTEKIRASIVAINENTAAPKKKASHDDPVKVVHSGGHWKHHKNEAVEADA